jgi:peptidoglycan/xylan/chitin deacetylase (PgdA/CDA1 family)
MPIRAVDILLFFILCQYQPGFAQASDQKSDPKPNLTTIYLSFDDGPMEESRYLDSLLTTDSIPINVFLVGENVFSCSESTPHIINYLNEPLVEIVNHSFTHAHKKYKRYYSEPARVVNDILLNEDTLGLKLRIARLPGRNAWRIGGRRRTDLSDATPAADSLATLGYTLVGWDIEWRFDTTTNFYMTAAGMLKAIDQLVVMKGTFTKQHIVILCHDPMLQDSLFRQELHLFAQKIKTSSRYQFGFVSDYPGRLPGDLTKRRDDNYMQ